MELQEFENIELTEEERTKLAEQFFCEIGRFAVVFDRVLHALSMGITFLLQENGLRNQQLAHIIVADQTAAPLKTMFLSMVLEVTKLDVNVETDKPKLKIVTEIINRVDKLIETRNILFHANLNVLIPSLKNNEQESHLNVAKPVRGNYSSKGNHKGVFGYIVKQPKYSLDDVKALCDECYAVDCLITRLWTTVISNKSILDNFEFIPSSGVRLK